SVCHIKGCGAGPQAPAGRLRAASHREKAADQRQHAAKCARRGEQGGQQARGGLNGTNDPNALDGRYSNLRLRCRRLPDELAMVPVTLFSFHAFCTHCIWYQNCLKRARQKRGDSCLPPPPFSLTPGEESRLGRVRRHFVSSVRAVGHRYAPAQAQAEVISSLARTCYSRS